MKWISNIRLNVFHLKIIGITFMLLEHVARFLTPVLPEHLPIYFIYVGRLVYPIFIFLAVESFFKTHDRITYITRLCFAAMVMMGGNLIMKYWLSEAYVPNELFLLSSNIFLSLTVGVSMIGALEYAKIVAWKERWMWYLLAGIFCALTFLTDFSFVGAVLFLLFYFFHNQRRVVYFGYALFCFLLLAWNWNSFGYMLVSPEQWMMIVALPLIMLYNGEPGNGKMKYFFYVFYPFHLWILYWIGYMIRMR